MRKQIEYMMNELEEAGFIFESVYDGETHNCDRREAVDLILDLDEATVYFSQNGMHVWILVIPSNGGDFICDYTFTKELDEVLCRKWYDPQSTS